MWSHIKNQTTLDSALKLARGSYQRAILRGEQCLSGADLRGNAKSYIGKYRKSSQNLIARCQAAGLNVFESVGRNNRRELIIN
jgi:hypothetical protein